jgi:tRNA uridine 5-carbamoylmethylation protein Kti12
MGNSISGRVVRRQTYCQTKYTSKTWFFVYLVVALWKSVLRLAVRGNSISGQVVRRQRVPVFEGHRLPSTGSRWDIRWVSGRGKNVVFVHLALAVMERKF